MFVCVTYASKTVRKESWAWDATLIICNRTSPIHTYTWISESTCRRSGNLYMQLAFNYFDYTKAKRNQSSYAGKSRMRAGGEKRRAVGRNVHLYSHWHEEMWFCTCTGYQQQKIATLTLSLPVNVQTDGPVEWVSCNAHFILCCQASVCVSLAFWSAVRACALTQLPGTLAWHSRLCS